MNKPQKLFILLWMLASFVLIPMAVVTYSKSPDPYAEFSEPVNPADAKIIAARKHAIHSDGLLYLGIWGFISFAFLGMVWVVADKKKQD